MVMQKPGKHRERAHRSHPRSEKQRLLPGVGVTGVTRKPGDQRCCHRGGVKERSHRPTTGSSPKCVAGQSSANDGIVAAMAGRVVVLWMQVGLATLWACSEPKAPPEGSQQERATLAGPSPAPSAASPLPVGTNKAAVLRDELLALPKDRGGDREAAKTLHRRAMTEHGRKDFTAAERTWAEAARTDPSWDWPFYNLACVAARVGRPDDAMAYLEAVRTRNPAADMIRRIATDHDFDALRRRPEFTAFLVRLTQQVAQVAAAQRYARAAGAAQQSRAGSAQSKPLEDQFPDRMEPGAAITDKMQRRIRFALRSVAKAPIAVRDIIAIPQEGGGMQVFGLYEYSVYEECVRGYATRAEGRDVCLDADDQRVRNNRSCVHLGVWHARFSTASDGSEDGGRVVVSQEPLSRAGCVVKQLDHYFVVDIDRDGELELFASLATEEKWSRDSSAAGSGLTYYTRGKSNVFIYSADATAAHFAFTAVSYEDKMGDMAPPRHESYEPVDLVDLDGDERLDIVRFEPCYNGNHTKSETPCTWPDLARTVYLYERTQDRWLNERELLGP